MEQIARRLLVCKILQLVSGEAVLIVQGCVMRGPGCALDAGVRVQEEVV